MARTVEELMNGKLEKFSDAEKKQIKEISRDIKEALKLIDQILKKLDER